MVSVHSAIPTSPNFPEIRKIKLLGVDLAAVTVTEAVDYSVKGGLILAPSGPGLCDLASDSHYREALLGSDLNLPDSGLAILLMKFLGMGTLPRTSGLGFLDHLLHSNRFTVTSPRTFWIMPNQQSMERNLQWIQSQGLPVLLQDCYIAPLYPRVGAVEDERLLQIIMERQPSHIFLCTGSGSQEKLGYWLKINLPYRPMICCIGAAIGFLSGDQVRIPSWADRLSLGWLFRCISEPQRFIPRYLKATKLIWLVLRYRHSSPAIVQA
jgi:UDP-N-acetyl-D-mannosaminuronic acid transferase (WecB/TagA/CpsF family)